MGRASRMSAMSMRVMSIASSVELGTESTQLTEHTASPQQPNRARPRVNGVWHGVVVGGLPSMDIHRNPVLCT